MLTEYGAKEGYYREPSPVFTHILDEPMNGLDKEGEEDMRGVFAKLRDEGKTILPASHSAEDIDLLCDAVYELDKGKMEKIK
ncbi:MAG: hypothetical protein IKH07_06980 [Oscillospiraceae bacterium]|nr:hypothetical protein [Oscillospiraceae bacterium]